jgi:hypothetical protein
LLNKCVKCTRGLHRRCRRHSFGMPSKQQAFPNFKDCTFLLKRHRIGT